MLTVLRHRSYRRLFAAQVLALLGTGLMTVVLALLAYELVGAQAGHVLGTALVVKMGAYVFVAPAMTAVTERVPRKALLVGADAVRATCACALPFIEETWQIYLLIFLLQSASATFTPAFQSLIPAILTRDEDYTRGLSLSRIAYDLEALLSPVVAAALLTVASYSQLFIGTAAGFAASAMLVLSTALPSMNRLRGPGSGAARGGMQLMLRAPMLRGLLYLNAVVAAATALVLVNTVVYVRAGIGGSDARVALALGCFGGGSMAAALAVPRLLGSFSERAVMAAGAVVSSAGLAAAAAALAAGPANDAVPWAGLCVLWLVLGGSVALILTPSARLIRYGVGAREHRAAFAAQFSLSHACFLFTYPIAGWGGSIFGQTAAAGSLAAIATLATAGALRTWPAAAPRASCGSGRVEG
jgi:hypothetical protein